MDGVTNPTILHASAARIAKQLTDAKPVIKLVRARKTSKVCYQVTIGAGFDITLAQKDVDNFSVQYGKQFTEKLTYTEAALELGACIMHALACEDKLDNRTKRDRS